MYWVVQGYRGERDPVLLPKQRGVGNEGLLSSEMLFPGIFLGPASVGLTHPFPLRQTALKSSLSSAPARTRSVFLAPKAGVALLY